MKIKLSDCLRPLALSTLLLCGMAHAELRPLDRVVAIVDNDVIMYSQLQRRLDEVRQNITGRGGELPPEQELAAQVLDRLIVENLQLQLGERTGIRVSDEELEQAMETIAQRNNLSLAQFQATLERDGLSYQNAREQVRRELIISRVRQRRIAERVQVSEQEVQNFLASDLGKLALGEEFRLANILIPISEGASAAEIQRAEQRAQAIRREAERGGDFARLAAAHSASENALDGGEIGWRKAAQLPPPFDRLVGEMQVGEVSEALRTPPGFMLVKLLEKRGGESSVLREEVRVRHILVKPSEIRSDEETRQLAERLYQRLRDGEDFASLAKRFSEDPGSALNGGDLNWITPDALVPEFREVMAASRIGELSQPFRSPFGWHVLEVLDRRTSDASGEAREQQALNLLRNRKYEEELQNWLRQIRDEAYVETRL